MRRVGRVGVHLAVVVVVAAVAVAACGSSKRSPVAAGRPGETTTTSSDGTLPSSVATTESTGRPTPGPTSTTRAPTPTTAPRTVDHSGVTGRVTAGPTCPVERPGQSCPPAPVHGRVDAVDQAGHTTGSATTDDTGRYAISLPAGRYTLRVDVGGQFPRCPDTTVTIAPGTTTVADIDCDTGIR